MKEIGKTKRKKDMASTGGSAALLITCHLSFIYFCNCYKFLYFYNFFIENYIFYIKIKN